MAEFDALVFDMDNTLFDEQQYFEQAFEAVAETVANETGLDQATAFGRISGAFEEKGSQYDNFFLHVAEMFDLDPAYHDVFYEQYLTVEVDLSLYDDAREILAWAEDEGFALGVLTSGSIQAQRNKIETLGLDERLEVTCVPRELGDGFEKPAPDAYAWVLDELGVEPERSVYIGDNPMSDFQGPKELGMTTIRLRRGEFADREVNASLVDHEITTHRTLPDIVG